MSTDADPTKLTDGMGKHWVMAETSFKWHTSCHHTHPAPNTMALRDKVSMALDVERRPAYPWRWIGKVTCAPPTAASSPAASTSPRATPGNTLSREEITPKALRLAAHGDTVPDGQAQAAIQRLGRRTAATCTAAATAGMPLARKFANQMEINHLGT